MTREIERNDFIRLTRAAEDFAKELKELNKLMAQMVKNAKENNVAIYRGTRNNVTDPSARQADVSGDHVSQPVAGGSGANEGTDPGDYTTGGDC